MPDAVVIGGGAAGLMAAITAARAASAPAVVVLDSARRLGSKILISGGGRCNLTNRNVRPSDFHSGSRRPITRVLAAWPPDSTIAFFARLGVTVHEEEGGKLFPDSNRAITVLDALLAEAHRVAVQLHHPARVERLEREQGRFVVTADAGVHRASRVVLATGGQSVPRTGSDGKGYELARSLGHSIVPTTPALAPLVLAGEFHTPLAGVSHPASLTIRSPGVSPRLVTGDLLWTHFGVSGPAALDASRHWHRALVEAREVTVDLSFRPGERFESVDAQLRAEAAPRPRATLATALAAWVPAAVATRLLTTVAVDGSVTLAHLARDDRRRLAHALTAWRLPVTDSRGFNYAEATAGGVPLDEVDPATMESKVCPGLYLAGEVLDVDGRLGGFNFEWAWASGYVAGRGVAR